MYYKNGDREMGNYLNDKKVGTHMILYNDGKSEVKDYDKKEINIEEEKNEKNEQNNFEVKEEKVDSNRESGELIKNEEFINNEENKK